MLSDLDNFYLSKQEPLKSCLLALKEIILRKDKNITPQWKYKMPFFYYKSKMFCYLWVENKTKKAYIGLAEGKMIDHPALISGNRSRMKIMFIDPEKDLPVDIIEDILEQAIKVLSNK